MLSEFVDRLVTLGQGVQSAEFTVHQLLPRTLFVQHAGKLERIEAPTPPRKHTLAGIRDLVEMLSETEVAPGPEIFISPASIVAMLDGGERIQTATVPLAESVRFRLCQSLETPREFSPRDLIKFLRLELHSSNLGALILSLSNLDFTRTSSGKTDVRHGRETLGRSVEAIVQQADNVPETFTVHVPIWSTPGCGVIKPITFGLYLNVDKQCVEVRALSDECANARNAAMADLRESLAKSVEHAAVFMGAP